MCCGAPMTWDPLREGYTCGGLHLVGWWSCAKCGGGQLCRASRPAERWKLAAGGRSVETGTARIRVDKCEATVALMARIVRLPDLEKTLRAIAAGAGNAQELAAAVLPASGPELDAGGAVEAERREAAGDDEADETDRPPRRTAPRRASTRGKSAHTGDLFGTEGAR